MYYFKQVKDGKVVSVESKSCKATSPGFVKATKAEYNRFIASLPIVEATPVRDLAAEYDKLVAELETKGVIE